jgi:hypothetical protein
VTDDLRAHVRAAISAKATLRGIDADPARSETVTGRLDEFTDAAMSALGDGAAWLMMQAEQYQARAHIAEKAIADSRPPRPVLPFGLDPAAVVCAVLACAVATTVQWRTGSEWDGNWAGMASLPLWAGAWLLIRHRRKRADR